MTRRRGVAAILAVGILAACGRSDPLARRAARLESLVDGSRIEKTVEKLSRVPHRAGTPAQRAVVAAVAEILRANGLETAVAEQTVNLPEPVEASLAVEGPAGRAFARAAPMGAFLYVDSSVRALDFMADASPGLTESLDETLRHVVDPVSEHPFLAVRPVVQLPGFSGDTSPFLGLGGVPSAQLGFGRRTYPQYHSAYDDAYLLGRFLDPGYVMSATLARILTLWTSVLAESSEPPWRLSEVASFLTDEFSRLGKAPAARLSRGGELFAAVVRLRLAARAWESLDAARRRASADRTEPLLLDAMGAFHDAAPEFARRNLLLGPSAETGCGTETLPGLRRALHGDGAVDAETARLLRALATAEAKLREAARIASGS